MKPIIKVEKLSKQYRLGAREVAYATVRESLVGAFRAPFNRLRRNGSSEETIWALKDLSFEIMPGEVVGIIGRNGAGKTTLLKILSRITEPTTGRAELYGRVGSLLEVGTGFHPELTGRENVFLNGAILGMKKVEIASKFDEIVAFAEIEKFLDTPVKRYSSGMYVRLAFAVAAYLDPEILIVDEVLAVGDAAFQKKCLGKMRAVASEGRTVLFVSHNVGAVQQLCTRAILLERSAIVFDDSPQKTVNYYLSMGMERIGERVWPELDQAPGNDIARLRAVRVLNLHGNVCTSFDVRDQVSVQMEYSLLQNQDLLDVSFYFYNDRGDLLFLSIERLRNQVADTYLSTCFLPPDFLNNGQIYVLAALTDEKDVHTIQRDIVSLNINDSMDPDGARGAYRADWPSAAVRPRLEWTVTRSPHDSGDRKETSVMP